MIEMITCEKSAGMEILKMLDIEEPKCSFCGIEINEENFGGVFSKPTRVSCNNLFCINEAVGDQSELVNSRKETINCQLCNKPIVIIHICNDALKFNKDVEIEICDVAYCKECIKKRSVGILLQVDDVWDDERDAEWDNELIL